MRSSPGLRQLPPLAPKSDWTKKFPLTTFNIVNRLSSYGGNKPGKRTNVVEPSLADEIVQGFAIDKKSHVLEAYPGIGVITRALLKLPPSHVSKLTAIEPASAFRIHGLGSQEPPGHADRETRIGQAWKKLTAVHHAQQETLKRKSLEILDDGNDVNSMLGETPGEPNTAIAVDDGRKASNLLEQLKKEAVDLKDKVQSEDSRLEASTFAKQSGSDDRPPDILTIRPSAHDERLQIVDDTIYDWSTFSKLDQMGIFSDVKPMAWNQASPTIRFVAHVPESDLGEQLVAQWIGCMANQSWLFTYGRVKISLIVRPTLFDRLTAVPGTKSYCKLSVMRAALCDYTPVASNYLNLSLEDMMSEVQLGRLQKQELQSTSSRAGAQKGTSTKTESKTKMRGSSFGRSNMADVLARYPDFAPKPSPQNFSLRALVNETRPNYLNQYYYPKLTRVKREEDRPGMMALTLEPKTTAWIDKHNKDVWDYVLRRMFVMQGSTLEVAIKNLGLGAVNLLPKITAPSLDSKRRVNPTKLVREYDLQDWSNIVRAFQEWKFAPDVLLLGSATHADEGSSRMLGSGM